MDKLPSFFRPYGLHDCFGLALAVLVIMGFGFGYSGAAGKFGVTHIAQQRQKQPGIQQMDRPPETSCTKIQFEML